MATVNSLLYILLTTGITTPIPEESVTTAINRYDSEVQGTTLVPPPYTGHNYQDVGSVTEKSSNSSTKPRKDCPENEKYTRLDASCQRNCDNYDKVIPCLRIKIWGCICKTGFVRGPNTKCIKIEDCPKKSGQAETKRRIYAPVDQKKCPINEHWDHCGANCQKNCSNYNDNIPCTKQCEPGCLCNDGYVRGADGKCIFPFKCPQKSEQNDKSNVFPIPKIICSQNETFERCPCSADCNNYKEKDRKCFVLICPPGCACKTGYVLGPNRNCIKIEECPKNKDFCPDGEEYSSCESNCEGSCINKGKDNDCSSTGFTCVSGCKCKNGLVRGPNGNCIYAKECPSDPPTEPPIRICPPDEEYTECSAGCQQNCTNVESPLPCQRGVCLSGCVCKKNLIRGRYGKCAEHAECSDSDSAGERDSDYETQTKVPPPVSRNDEKSEQNSVKKEDQFPFPFPKPIICQGNETLERCPCPADCNNYKDKDRKCNTIICVPGCTCKKDYVIGPDKNCIKVEECPGNKKCPPGERYSECDANCQKNCTNWAYDLICPKKCVGGCVCKSEQVRGRDGKCTYWFNCLQKSSPFESSRD